MNFFEQLKYLNCYNENKEKLEEYKKKFIGNSKRKKLNFKCSKKNKYKNKYRYIEYPIDQKYFESIESAIHSIFFSFIYKGLK